MATIPSSHIHDAHKLTADAEIYLYELTPANSTGILRFKNDNTVSWLANEYTGLPLSFSGESYGIEGSSAQPQLTIGQPDIDLSMFKGLIWDGNLDGARIDRHLVLLDDIINNRNIKRTRTYRVKRVEGYSASSIQLILSTFSPAGPQSLPFRQFIPPAFPFVRLQ